MYLLALKYFEVLEVLCQSMTDMCQLKNYHHQSRCKICGKLKKVWNLHQKNRFSFMPESDFPSSQSHLSAYKIDDYLEAASVSMCTNIAKFQKENQNKYLLLLKLAKEVLGVPSSLSPVERLFSIASKNNDRYRLPIRLSVHH